MTMSREEVLEEMEQLARTIWLARKTLADATKRAQEIRLIAQLPWNTLEEMIREIDVREERNRHQREARRENKRFIEPIMQGGKKGGHNG